MVTTEYISLRTRRQDLIHFVGSQGKLLEVTPDREAADELGYVMSERERGREVDTREWRHLLRLQLYNAVVVEAGIPVEALGDVLATVLPHLSPGGLLAVAAPLAPKELHDIIKAAGLRPTMAIPWSIGYGSYVVGQKVVSEG